MPLPDLNPEVQSNQRQQAAFLDDTYYVHPDDLRLDRRIACLSEIGTYLLSQRWVYHSSRLVVPVTQYEEMNSHVFSEADLLESWCELAADEGVLADQAMMDAAEWLGVEVGSVSRRLMLRNSALRSTLIRDVKRAAKDLYHPTAPVKSA